MSKSEEKINYPEIISSDTFEADNHFYPKTVNATISSVVYNFMTLTNDRMLSRYCHLHPFVDSKLLKSILVYKPLCLKWSGGNFF